MNSIKLSSIALNLAKTSSNTRHSTNLNPGPLNPTRPGPLNPTRLDVTLHFIP